MYRHRFRLKKTFERKIVNTILPISLNICFGCSKEPSHWDVAFEYPQHMFWLRNKNFFVTHSLLKPCIEDLTLVLMH